MTRPGDTDTREEASAGFFAPRQLVVATGNPHKLGEIWEILSEGRDLHVELVSMRDLGVPEPVEDGTTFEANALIKARACVAFTGLPALADDSGLEVDALDGAPGIRSARYAGEPSDDAANNAKLLAALRDVSAARRTARFVAAAAIATPSGFAEVRLGTMPGRIVDEPRGGNGFGYDPYFVSDGAGDGRTNAELSAREKHVLSHRGAAFRTLLPIVQQIFGGR